MDIIAGPRECDCSFQFNAASRDDGVAIQDGESGIGEGQTIGGEKRERTLSIKTDTHRQIENNPPATDGDGAGAQIQRGIKRTRCLREKQTERARRHGKALQTTDGHPF